MAMGEVETFIAFARKLRSVVAGEYNRLAIRDQDAQLVFTKVLRIGTGNSLLENLSSRAGKVRRRFQSGMVDTNHLERRGLLGCTLCSTLPHKITAL